MNPAPSTKQCLLANGDNCLQTKVLFDIPVLVVRGRAGVCLAFHWNLCRRYSLCLPIFGTLAQSQVSASVTHIHNLPHLGSSTTYGHEILQALRL